MISVLIGGAGFVGSRLKTVLNSYLILDKALTYTSGYVDITKPDSLKAKINLSDVIVLLAAEHRDDVSPISKYYDTKSYNNYIHILRQWPQILR